MLLTVVLGQQTFVAARGPMGVVSLDFLIRKLSLELSLIL